jgi:predicted deacylase
VGEPEPISIGDNQVRAGTEAQLELPIGRLATGSDMALPVRVVHGALPGPTVWLNAAIHGDEVCGVEIITRVLRGLNPVYLAGTVLAVPVVNVHGFIGGDRYLPDHRDLNRSFPGSATGSLAAQIAHLFMTEIVSRSDIGIDLHTASNHRSNLPQIRADLDDPPTRRLAEAFGAPVMVHAPSRAGTLRRAATRRGSTVLVYEAGEALRFDEQAIVVGVGGVRRVLAAVGLTSPVDPPDSPSLVSRSTAWVRAPRSGILHLHVSTGAVVARRQVLGTVDDAFANSLATIRAPRDGLVIGQTRSPIVNRGDAVLHVATID